MKKLAALVTFILMLPLGAALSQVSMVGVNVAATGQMPVGEFADTAGFGVGGLLGIEVGMYPGLALTARSGYIYHFKNNDVVYTQVPVLGGLKFTLPATPLYLAGELGALFTQTERAASGIYVGGTTSQTNFTWGAGLGSMVGPVDLRLMFNVLDARHTEKSMTLGLSLGFSLWSTGRTPVDDGQPPPVDPVPPVDPLPEPVDPDQP